MKTVKPDVWLAVCVIVGALIYLYSDSQIVVSQMGDALGPRAFPALIGCGLLLSGILLLFEIRTKSRAAKNHPPATAPAPAAAAATESDASGKPLPSRGRQIFILLAMVAWTALYYSTFEELGYPLTTFVFLGGLLSYFHRGHYVTNLLVALGFTVVVDVVFSHLLNVPLPLGILSI